VESASLKPRSAKGTVKSNMTGYEAKAMDVTEVTEAYWPARSELLQSVRSSLFHVGIPLFGYVGVDVFFVISGFLITGCSIGSF
jgi:hypothetical protein